jgi:hypothetical protein
MKKKMPGFSFQACKQADAPEAVVKAVVIHSSNCNLKQNL